MRVDSYEARRVRIHSMHQGESRRAFETTPPAGPPRTSRPVGVKSRRASAMKRLRSPEGTCATSGRVTSAPCPTLWARV